MSQIIPVHEASKILPELIKRASDGETVLIGDEGQAEVSLNAIPKKRERKIGLLSHKKFTMAEDFDAPLSPEIFANFGCNK